MRSPPVASLVSLVAGLVGGSGLLGCDPPASTSGCANACATDEPACADGCPSIATEVCADDACVAVAAGVVDLAITVNIDRELDRDVDGVDALAIAVVDVGSAGTSCADVGDVADAAYVLAGNRFDVSGGTFHPDLRVGLVPEGQVLVAVDALTVAAGGAGVVVGSGCVAVDAAGSAGAVTVEVK